MHPLKNVDEIAGILLLQILKYLVRVSMACVFHVSEIWWLAASFPELGVFSSLFISVWFFCPCFLAAFIFSCPLTRGLCDFRFRITELPFSWCLADFFSFIVILRIDSRSQTWWGSFLLCTGCASPDSQVLLLLSVSHRSDMAPIKMRPLASEKKIWNGCTNTSRNSYLTNTGSDSVNFFRETSFGQNVGGLVFGVSILDLIFWFHVDSVAQPIKSNSVRSWTRSSLDFVLLIVIFDFGFVVLKDVQKRFTLKSVLVGE